MAALSSQPSFGGALATLSGAAGSVQSSKNASKALARAFWFLNRTIAYNPTNGTQVKALATYTYRRLQFESLLKQGEKKERRRGRVKLFSFSLPSAAAAALGVFFLAFASLFFPDFVFLLLLLLVLQSTNSQLRNSTGSAFTTTSAVPSFGGGAVIAALANITCFIDPSTGIVTNLQQASKVACTAGGQRVVIPSAGKYVTKLEMAVDKDLPLVGRFVFHVRDTLDSKPRVYTCGFAGGEAISLFPAGYGKKMKLLVSFFGERGGFSASFSNRKLFSRFFSGKNNKSCDFHRRRMHPADPTGRGQEAPQPPAGRDGRPEERGQPGAGKEEFFFFGGGGGASADTAAVVVLCFLFLPFSHTLATPPALSTLSLTHTLYRHPFSLRSPPSSFPSPSRGRRVPTSRFRRSSWLPESSRTRPLRFPRTRCRRSVCFFFESFVSF